jgi:mono/diheme cytochrome c family protein
VRIAVASSALALAACGAGDGFETGTGGGALEATHASIQASIFTPICEQCHSGAGAPVGLRLDAANSFALLVGVPSGEQPSILRVAPGDPDNSYLIQKLEGTAGVGQRMPLRLPPLPQSDIDVIRQWITDGAQPGGVAPNLPIQVISMSPLPNLSTNSLASITVVFSRELNAPSIMTTTFSLERSGGDGVFGNGNDVAITPSSVTVPAANPRSAVLALAGVRIVGDTYRVTLIGTGAAVIQDLAGNALDGEFSGAFPSGDGAAGGNFQAQFTVAAVQPTLASIQERVFTPVCSGCHAGGGTALPRSMDLTSAAASHAALVNADAVESALNRVTPGQPDQSYLIHKIEGGPGIVGQRMPLGAPPLDTATIGAIRQWITNGAAP